MKGFVLLHVEDAFGEEAVVGNESGVNRVIAVGDDKLAGGMQRLINHGPVFFQDGGGQKEDSQAFIICR